MGTNITGIGNANAIGFKSRVTGGMYFPPELKDALVGVWSAYGKSNNSTDRNIIKNKIKDKGGDFVISNAAYIEGSGYADKDSQYYGAFVTDGIDDLIKSTKSATEMLDGSNEVTVVSMIHQIKTNSDVTRNNWFFTPVSYLENRVVENKTGKTGIYGYTSTNVTNAQISDITPILGDKNDYTLYSKIEDGDRDYFTVEGFQNQGIWYVSSIAWYWTIIANKVLTTDEINQVIAYYNLDRTLKPDILCNVKKQRITNENHAEFGDKLIDYSGNGRDIQLNNIAWNKESGIDDNGALRLDGVDDFGKVTGMPIYKDYTVVVNKDRISTDTSCILSKATTGTNVGAFITEFSTATYSFGLQNAFRTQRVGISYQSKYVYNGERELTAGSNVDTDTMWLGTIRDNDSRFFNGAIYSLMSFPYSMSEFLIERQLKKHKLGTLYPNMVELRPVIKANANYKIFFTALLPLTGSGWEKINIGDYIPVGRRVAIQLSFDNEASELVSAISSQLGNIGITKNSNNKGYTIFGDILKSKSPQKINITIDEYIRYEDIVQPYPVLLRFNDENGNEVSWGGKFRVGSTITRIGSAADSNLLPDIYNIFGLLLNGNQVTSSNVIVEKTMVFKAKSTYIFDGNEPKSILSPRLLRMPNLSYKILGHIPDISGHGNHGVIYNSAYAKGSGVNEDGSYQFDGVDDFVTIPTATGGKQVLMKVNSRKSDCYLYDQRNDWTQYLGIVSTKDFIAYNYLNQHGKTYINGILNENITANDLISITHNITVTNNRDDVEQYSPCIGTSFAKNSFSEMALYDFMLFDEVNTDEEIKQLNDIVGIEGDFYEMDFNNDFLIGN